jgi:hypothetical protein
MPASPTATEPRRYHLLVYQEIVGDEPDPDTAPFGERRFASWGEACEWMEAQPIVPLRWADVQEWVGPDLVVHRTRVEEDI